jgi:hypothetical protein
LVLVFKPKFGKILAEPQDPIGTLGVVLAIVLAGLSKILGFIGTI